MSEPNPISIRKPQRDPELSIPEPEAEEEVSKSRLWYQTRDLLRNYRGLCRHRDRAVWENHGLAGEEYSPQVYAKWMEDRRSSGTVIIQSIARSAEVTRTLMQHVDAVLAQFETDCRHSRDKTSQGQWRILKARYINKQPKSIQDLAEQLHISVRTAYRWHDLGIRRLTAYLYGADAIALPKEQKDSPAEGPGRGPAGLEAKK